MFGWFHDSANDNYILNSIAEKYKNNGRVGRCKYLDNATLYTLHLNDVQLPWITSQAIDSLKRVNVGASNLAFLVVAKNFIPSQSQPLFKATVLYERRLPVANATSTKPILSSRSSIPETMASQGHKDMQLEPNYLQVPNSTHLC